MDRLQPWVRNVPSQVLKSSPRYGIPFTSLPPLLDVYRAHCIEIESLTDVTRWQAYQGISLLRSSSSVVAATHLELLPTHGFAKLCIDRPHTYLKSPCSSDLVSPSTIMSLIVHDITLEQVSKDPRHIHIQSWWGSAVVCACHASNDTYDLQVSQFRPFSSSL